MLDDLRKQRDNEKKSKKIKEQMAALAQRPQQNSLAFAGASVLGFGNSPMITNKDHMYYTE